MSDLHRLGSLLARWHVWRKGFTTERSYARQGGPVDPEDTLEALLMTAIETEVDHLSLEDQRALQQIAQAECLGVEAHRPGPHHAPALDLLRSRLIDMGLL